MYLQYTARRAEALVERVDRHFGLEEDDDRDDQSSVKRERVMRAVLKNNGQDAKGLFVLPLPDAERRVLLRLCGIEDSVETTLRTMAPHHLCQVR